MLAAQARRALASTTQRLVATPRHLIVISNTQVTHQTRSFADDDGGGDGGKGMHPFPLSFFLLCVGVHQGGECKCAH
jgi:hypothetical protein